MRNKAYPFYFAGGALVLYLLFFVLPSLMGFYYAFTDWNSYSPEVNFVGLDNFRLIFSQGSGQNYLHFIQNTVIFTVATIFLKTVIALGLALLLTNGISALAHFHRVVMYLPAVLPMLVVSLVFRSILNPATGLLNTFLRSVGLDFLAQRWLVDVDWALPSVIGVDTWRGVGYIMVILIAGIQSIPRDYYEAAAIDGASGFGAFWRITLPLLMPVLTIEIRAARRPAGTAARRASRHRTGRCPSPRPLHPARRSRRAGPSGPCAPSQRDPLHLAGLGIEPAQLAGPCAVYQTVPSAAARHRGRPPAGTGYSRRPAPRSVAGVSAGCSVGAAIAVATGSGTGVPWLGAGPVARSNHQHGQQPDKQHPIQYLTHPHQ